jgi:hypothetical protein
MANVSSARHVIKEKLSYTNGWAFLKTKCGLQWNILSAPAADISRIKSPHLFLQKLPMIPNVYHGKCF